MGDINNLFYVKNSGNDWCNTKCSIDVPYAMPYKNGDYRALQFVVSSDYIIERIWFCDLAGNRLYNVTNVAADYRKVVGEFYTTVTFKIPTLGDDACPKTVTGFTDGCVFDIVSYLTFLGASFIGLYNNYIAGTGGVTMSISYNGGAYLFPPTLPLGWSNAPDNLFYIPCPDPEDINVDIKLNFYIDDVLNTQTDVVRQYRSLG